MTTNINLDIIHQSAKGYHNEETTKNYVKGRPSLPLETIDFIKNNFNLTPQSKLLDLASGTGKFTELLAGYGGFNDITAVEPSPEFRNACTTILTDLAKVRSELKFQVLNGTASQIPLPDDSVDAMFAAQAFHWFSNEESLREMIRVLKPGAPLILVWYQLDEPNLVKIFDVHAGDTPMFRTLKWREAFEIDSLSQKIDSNLQNKKFVFTKPSDCKSVTQSILSMSYISLLPEDKKAEICNQIKTYLERYPENFDLPFNVELFYTFKK